MKKKIIFFKTLYFVFIIIGVIIGVIIDSPIIVGLFSGMLLGGVYQIVSKSSIISMIDENTINKYLEKKK